MLDFLFRWLVTSFVIIYSFQFSVGFAKGQIVFPRDIQPTTTPFPNDLDLLSTFKNLTVEQREDCKLPCWWGFVPGKTTLQEVITFIQKFGLDRQWERSIYSSLDIDQYLRLGELILLNFRNESYLMGGNFNISFGFDKNDRLTGTRLYFYKPGEWLMPEADKVSFPKILAEIDAQPEIYIFQNIRNFVPATKDTPQQYSWVNPRFSEYIVYVFFQEQGIRINYNFELSFDMRADGLDIDVAKFHLCPSLKNTNSVELILTAAPNSQTLDPEFYVPPEDAFGVGISTEEFVQFFKENPDACFDSTGYNNSQE